MKKRLLLIAAALICAVMFTTCDLLKNAVKEPEVSLKSVDFSAISFDGLTLLSTLSVKNNNSIDIPLPNIDWELFVIGNPFLKGIIESAGSLKSNDSTEVKFPVSFDYVELIETIINLTDDSKYKIDLTAHIPVPNLGELSFPFFHEGKIPHMKLPDITVASAPKAALTYGSGILPIPTGGKIEFSLNVKNNSNIAVIVKDLSCILKIGNTELTGKFKNEPQINAKDTQKLDFELPITTADIANIGLNVLTGSSLNYSSFTGNYKFGIPDFPLLDEVGDSFTF